MTAKELKKILEEVDDEIIIVLANDEEGNGFSPLADTNADMVYKTDSTYSGEIGYDKLTTYLRGRGYTKEDLIEGGEKCLILWPTN